MDIWDCLIVDDEKLLCQSAAEYCTLLGVRTKGVMSADECRDFLKNNSAKVIILDINLTGENGFSLCRELRESTDAPILFLSARTSDDDKIAAYELGGDDYIQKPCSLSVLVAKIRAVLKRLTGTQAYSDGYLSIDWERREVRAGGKVIRLTPTEYRILICLAEKHGCVVSKSELFHEVWGETIAGDGTLNVHIRHLRERIEPDPSRPSYIVTVHGEGYKFVPSC